MGSQVSDDQVHADATAAVAAIFAKAVESEDDLRAEVVKRVADEALERMEGALDGASNEASAKILDWMKLGRVVTQIRGDLKEGGHGRGLHYLGKTGVPSADRIADLVLSGLVTHIYELAKVEL